MTPDQLRRPNPQVEVESVGAPVRPAVAENHRLVCGGCRNPWHPVHPDDPDDPAWYGRCANCDSADLLVESEVVEGAPPTDEWHLRCVSCDATWIGIPGDPCEWCQRSAEIQAEHQAELLLTVPDVHPDDERYAGMMEKWAERLAIGVEAGLITERMACDVGRRADRSRAA